MRQKRIVVPTRSLDDWREFLAEPDKHWKPRHSAMLTAQSWESASGLPPEIAAAFSTSKDLYFRGVEVASEF